MTKEQATPRPWKLGEERRPGHILIMSKGIKRGDFVIAETLLVEGKLVGNYEANARLIVKAVNCHDELVSTLNDVEEMLNIIADDLCQCEEARCCNYHRLHSDVKQALQKAGAI